MDLDLVEYKGVQLRKNEAEVLYELEELTLREFSFGKKGYTFSQNASMEIKISNNTVWKLGLYNSGLERLPDSIGELTHLDTLWVGRNNLMDLPESFINLKTLRQLDISRNKLYFIPESIFKHHNLMYLNLAFNINRLILDDEIKFVKLLELDLRGNNIRSLPEQMKKLIYLRRLSIQFTGLRHLPKSLTILNRLEVIYLEDRYFTQESLGVLQMLEKKGVEIINVSDYELFLRSYPVTNEMLEKLELLDYISQNAEFLNLKESEAFSKISNRVERDAVRDTIENFSYLTGDYTSYDSYGFQGEFEQVSHEEIKIVLIKLKKNIDQRIEEINSKIPILEEKIKSGDNHAINILKNYIREYISAGNIAMFLFFYRKNYFNYLKIEQMREILQRKNIINLINRLDYYFYHEYKELVLPYLIQLSRKAKLFRFNLRSILYGLGKLNYNEKYSVFLDLIKIIKLEGLIELYYPKIDGLFNEIIDGLKKEEKQGLLTISVFSELIRTIKDTKLLNNNIDIIEKKFPQYSSLLWNILG